MKLQKLILAFASILLILPACSKKDTSTPALTYKTPSVTSQTQITIPAGFQAQADTNIYAGLVASFMIEANGLSAYSSAYCSRWCN
jgi:hypothetical protein